ncbi:MAG: hypothetical protein ACJ8AD_18970, partial [Gemmatimonadaceae bacterium]
MLGRSAFSILAIAALTSVLSCAQAPARTGLPGYDLVITGGRIVDGTGNPWVYGDVAVTGDRIARVAPRGALAEAPTRRRIDATGLVVAPGFI